MSITNEDLKLIDKFNEIMQHGYYADGAQVTELYNRVINPQKPLTPTNCSACIRRRISDLVNFKNKFEKQLEIKNKAVSEPSETLSQDEVMKDRMAKVRAARKKK